MKKKKIIEDIATYAAIIVMLFFTLLPILILFFNAFKSNDTFMFQTGLLPDDWTLDNFTHVIEKANFLLYIKNSLIVGVVVTAITIIVTGMSGYALSRFKGKIFTGFKVVTYAYQLVPLVLILVPLFVIVRTMGLFDSLLSVILCYIAFEVPLCSWIMKGYFDTIPIDIEESAFIDGCTRMQSFSRIIIPLALPGVASAAVITFNYTWCEYMLANLFINDENVKTITVGLSTFVEQNNTRWGYMMAGAVLASIPAILLIILAQKYVVQGLSSGAVKE